MNNQALQNGCLAYNLDVAIVGAGASGIYSAHRLLDTTNLMVFDLSDRIGGRLFSKQLDGMDYMSELGGMRYITSQRLITSLIEGADSPISKKVTPIDFPMGTDGSDLIYYLRGKRYLQNDFVKKKDTVEKVIVNYGLRKEDEGLTADQLFSKVVYLVLKQSQWFVSKYAAKISNPSFGTYEIKLNTAEWLDVKNNLTYDFDDTPYTGKKINDIGFWNLIKDLIGQEGYNYLAEAGGYYSNTINWNSAEAFEYMIGDFSPEVSYKTLLEGFNKIILELAHLVDPSLSIDTEGNVSNIGDGAKIKMRHRLNAIAKVPFDKVDYYLQNHDRNGRAILPHEINSLQSKVVNKFVYVLTFDILDEAGEPIDWVRVEASKVILGMPRRSLELLMPNNASFFAASVSQSATPINFDSAYRSVIKEPSYKLVMVYHTAWWQQLKITSGHSITDLPMRQCYYFPSNEVFQSNIKNIKPKHIQEGHNEKSNAVLLSSYGDMVTESFWKPLSDQPLNTDAYSLKECIKDKSVAESNHYEVLDNDSSFVKEAQKQLEELHGLKNIQIPLKVYFKDWTDDPFGAGYHAWKASADVSNTRLFMRDVFNDSTFHIIGESYSTQQGWVEGAFFEAERVMKDHFGLSVPNWFVGDEGIHTYKSYMYPENPISN